MEFEIKEINGSKVYVRKDKKVVEQRKDFPGSNSTFDSSKFMKFVSELHSSCSHNCSSCHSNCGGK